MGASLSVIYMIWRSQTYWLHCGFLLLSFFAQAQKASALSLVQEFFVAIPEDELQPVLSNIESNGTVDTEIRSIISIVPGEDGTVIFYDHWEDGYEEILLSPTQSTTQIWGDNNPANGIPIGFTNDIVNAGDIITLENTIDTTIFGQAITNYNGGDKFATTKPLATTRAFYPETVTDGATTFYDPGTVMAGAAQILDSTQYGLFYLAPVGTNTLGTAASPTNMFEYAGAFIMAAQDPTLVSVDTNADGAVDEVRWLNQGDTWYIDNGIREGATFRGEKPIQVHLITGQDITAGLEVRLFTLFPRYQWDSDFITPVGQSGTANNPTVRVFMHNPNTNSITVTYTNQSTSGTINIAAGATASYTMPTNTGGRFYTTSGDLFVPVSTVDSSDPTSYRDWGYGIVPRRTLTTQAIISYGPGDGVLGANANPMWVTSDSNTVIYIDYDSDPSTGANLETNTGTRYDVAITNAPFDMNLVYVPTGNDQTGVRAYTIDGAYVSAAWGQDANVSQPAAAFLDMGTTIMPFPVIILNKSHEFEVDLDGDNLADPGDSIRYTLTVVNAGFQDVQNVVLTDVVPEFTSYATNSTTTNETGQADDGSGTPFPVDENGLNIGTVVQGGTATVSYVMTVSTNFPTNALGIINGVYLVSSEGQRGDIDPIAVQRDGLSLLKSATDETFELGSTVTYEVVLINTGTVRHSYIRIEDLLPSTLTYSNGSATIITSTNIVRNTFRDEFSSQAYTNNDGTAVWTGDWIEIGETNGATTGDVQVATNNVASLGNSGVGFYRQANLGGYSNGVLRFSFRRNFLNLNSETLSVGVSTNGGAGWTNLVTLSASQNDSQLVKLKFDISRYLTTNTQFRFLTGGSGWTPANDFFLLDNIEVDVYSPGAGSITNSANDPPYLVNTINLDPGEGVFISYQAVVTNDTVQTQVVNEACVISDRNQEEICFTTTNRIRVTDLVLSKTVDAVNVATGGLVTFTIAITNLGPETASSIEVTDVVPSGLTYVSNTTSQGTYNDGSGLWDVGSLVLNGSATLEITAQVDAGTEGDSITNTACVTNVDPMDRVSSNDCDSVVVYPGNAALDFTKTSSPSTVLNIGDTITYTILATNTGDIRIDNVDFTDTLPSGVTYVASSISVATYGASPPFAITNTLRDEFGTVAYTNQDGTANWSGDWTEVEAEGSPNNIDIIVTGGGELQVANDLGYDTQLAGIYRTMDLTGATNATFTYDWRTEGDLETTDSMNIEVSSNGTDWVLLTNYSGLNGFGPFSGSDSFDITAYISSNAAIRFKTAAFYGASDEHFVVDDVQIEYLSPNPDTTPSGTLGLPPNIGTDYSIPPGTAVEFTFDVTVDSVPPSTNLVNTACYTANQIPAGACDSATNTAQWVDLGLGKTINVGAAPPGTEIFYTISVTNFGPSTATNVIVTDALPSGVTYASNTASVGTYASDVWTIGTMTSGAVETLTIYADIDAGTEGDTITNTACVSDNSITNINSANDCDSVLLFPGNPDYEITKTSSPTTVLNPGDTLTYTVNITNAGLLNLSNLDVTDTLPTGVTYVADSISVSTFGSQPPLTITNTLRDEFGTVAYTNQDGTANWSGDWTEVEAEGTPNNIDIIVTGGGELQVANDLGYDTQLAGIYRTMDLTGATNATFTYDWRTEGDLETTDSMNIEVSSNGTDWVLLTNYSGLNGFGPFSGSDSFDITAYISSNAAIRFKTAAFYGASDEHFVVDDVQVEYLSPNPDATPVGTVGAPPSIGTDYSLPQGTAVEFTFDVTVDSVPPSTNITNQVCVTSDQIPAQTCATATNTVRWVDLVAFKTVNNLNPQTNDTITYSMIVSNAGPFAATNVTATDLLPTGVTYVSHIASTGTYVSGTGLWTIGDLGVGDTETLSIDATVDAGTVGDAITNTICVTNVGFVDSNTGNDCASTIIYPGQASMQITKSASPVGLVAPGDTIRYTMLVTNTGSTPLSDIEVTDTLPAGVTYVPNSIQVLHPDDVNSTNNFRDQFDAIAWTNDDGTVSWTTDWDETGEADDPTAGDIRVTTWILENYVMQFRNNNERSVSREFDLSSAITATLSYEYQRHLYEASEEVTVEISIDGGSNWTVLATHAGNGNSDSSFTSVNIDISSYNRSNTMIRVNREDAWTGSGEAFNIDNIDVSYVSAVQAGTKGPPPSLTDGFGLGIGEAMTVYFDVTVDAPSAITQIVNTACATSDQVTTPVCASVTNPVEYADLCVLKTITDPTGATTSVVNWTYVLTVTNLGPHEATGIVVEDFWPSNATYKSFAVFNGEFDPGTFIWSGFNLASGATARLELVAEMTNITADVGVTNIATITSMDQWDADASNNSVTNAFLATRVVVSDFGGVVRDGQTIVTWETSSELGTAGFNLYRRDNSQRRYRKVNREFVPGLIDSPVGGAYEVLDESAVTGRKYQYRLEELEVNGSKNFYGPYRVTFDDGLEEELGAQLGAGGFTARPREPSKRERIRRGDIRETRKAGATIAKAPSIDPEELFEEGRFFFDIHRKGIHRLELSELSAVSGVPRRLLRNIARDSRFLVGLGEREIPSRLSDAEDAIIFYGIHEPDLYSTQTVYWLEFENEEGLEQQSSEAGAPVTEAQSFRDVMIHEVDRKANVLMQRGTRDDYWYEDSLLAGYAGLDSKSYAFDLPGRVAGSNGMLRLYLHGGTESGKPDEHHAIVRINGEEVADVRWTGRREMLVECEVDSPNLQDAGNVIEVQAIRDPGIPYSFVFMNHFELEYSRRYEVVSDSLHFRNRDYGRITLSGLSTDNPVVWNVSDPYEPEELEDMLVTGSGSSARVTIGELDDGATYVATSEEAFYSIRNLRVRLPSSLKDKSNDFNYVIITSDELKSAAQDYADYREARGLRPMVATVEEIYDHFGDGGQHPDAIRAFLEYASEEWAGGPRYVLLLGGGTYDYRGLTGNEDNLVPAPLMYTSVGRFASDGMYTDFDGDGLPEIPIGRLPAISEPEVQNMLAKVEAYETHPREDWVRRVILLTDNTDEGGSFKGSTSGIIAESELPEDLINLDMNELGAAGARSALLEAWAAGSAFVNYLGHGSHDRLANEGVLKTDDVDGMNNLTNMPVLTALSCIVGRFEVPGYDSLSESLVLEEDGGAIAVISASGLLMNHKSSLLGKGIYRARYNQRKGILGDVYQAGLRHYSENAQSMGNIRLYNLLGDPALMLAGADAGYEEDDGGFDIWWRSRYTVDEQLESGDNAAEHDGDYDGLKDLLEYALGADPHTADQSIWRRAHIADDGGKGQMVLEFQRRKGLKDVDYEIQVSGDMEEWGEDPGYLKLDAVLPGDDDSYEIMRYTLEVDEVDQTLYFRLMITRP